MARNNHRTCHRAWPSAGIYKSWQSPQLGIGTNYGLGGVWYYINRGGHLSMQSIPIAANAEGLINFYWPLSAIHRPMKPNVKRVAGTLNNMWP